MTNIHSHWHHAQEIAKGGHFLMRNKQGVLERLHFTQGWNPEPFVKALDCAHEFQRYVLSDEVKDLAKKHKSSVKDLIEAKITDLPFSAMSIEFMTPVNTGVVNTPGTFQDREPTFVILAKYPNREFTHRSFCFSLPLLHDRKTRGLLVCPLVLDLRIAIHEDEPAIQANTGFASWIENIKSFTRYFKIPETHSVNAEDSPWYNEMCDMGGTFMNCMVLLNTRGIEREQISAPVKLNKQRLHANRPAILDHTVIKIGKVYTKSGEAIAYNSSGRHMPIHLRAGHTRHQHYGPKNEKIKIVYIPPVLVNYAPDQSPSIKPRVVK